MSAAGVSFNIVDHHVCHVPGKRKGKAGERYGEPAISVQGVVKDVRGIVDAIAPVQTRVIDADHGAAENTEPPVENNVVKADSGVERARTNPRSSVGPD